MFIRSQDSISRFIRMIMMVNLITMNLMAMNTNSMETNRNSALKDT